MLHDSCEECGRGSISSRESVIKERIDPESPLFGKKTVCPEQVIELRRGIFANVTQGLSVLLNLDGRIYGMPPQKPDKVSKSIEVRGGHDQLPTGHQDAPQFQQHLPDTDRRQMLDDIAEISKRKAS